MRVLFSIIILINILIAEDFISKFEYGQMLFENPRGVSCKKCHGKVGEGKLIASFIDSKGEKREFWGPDIRGLDYKSFKKAVESGGRIMPRFYLTNKELEAIYKFIKIVNMPPKEKEEALNKEDEIDAGSEEEIKKVVQKNIELEKNLTKKDENIDNNIAKSENEVEVNDIFEDDDADLNSVKEIDNNDIFNDDVEGQISDNNKDSIISNIFNNIIVDDEFEDDNANANVNVEVEESY